jgi:hypothetical protein
MATRRTLVEGLNETPEVDPQLESQFVFNKLSRNPESRSVPKPASAASISRLPISTRLRTDLAEALKRASLQRQLEKVEPSSLTEIIEAAIEPWLKSNGYLP